MSEEQKTTIMAGCELPSRGQIYDTPVDPNVELRAMTGREELMRKNMTNKPLKLMADIIEGCMLHKPNIHVYDMAAGDYEYLLHKIRIVSYGPMYKMNLKCPYCLEDIETTTNLEDQDMAEFDVDEFNQSRIFKLPVSGDTVSIGFMTPRIIEDCESKANELKHKYKNAAIDFETYVKMASLIEKVNGNTLKESEKETFIYSLNARDFRKIMLKIDETSNKLGLDPTIYVTCPKCGKEIKTFFRSGDEFFGPSDVD